jgi:hypothetical protein
VTQGRIRKGLTARTKASIRPQEAGVILVDLNNSDDEDIVEAAHEAIAMAEGQSSDEFDVRQ